MCLCDLKPMSIPTGSDGQIFQKALHHGSNPFVSLLLSFSPLPGFLPSSSSPSFLPRGRNQLRCAVAFPQMLTASPWCSLTPPINYSLLSILLGSRGTTSLRLNFGGPGHFMDGRVLPSGGTAWRRCGLGSATALAIRVCFYFYFYFPNGGQM